MAAVLVVGAGVIGLACGYHLAEQGHSVQLVDSGTATGASWVAAGMLAPVSEASFGEAELTRLTLAAVPVFGAFAGALEQRTRQSVGLRAEGTLVVAGTADDRAALDRLSAYRDSLGLATERLTGSGARALEPYLASTVRAGVLARGDLSVDNRRYLAALSSGCRLAGVTTTTGTVTGLLQSGSRVTGVRLDGGAELRADLVLLCSGAATGALVELGVRPVKGQILRLRVPDRLGTVLRHTVRGLIRGSEVYLVPRADGELVVGATSEDQGFDTTVTAGAVYELLRDAAELLPVSSEFGLLEASAGSRPGTADNGPLLGWVEPGLLVATGHYRNGILLSAFTAEAVGMLLAGSQPPPEWKPFDACRFTARPG
jgi:glycine oxidase